MKIVKFVMLLAAVSFFGACSLDPAVRDNIEVGEQNTAEDLSTLINGAYSEMSDYHYMGRNFIVAGEVRSDNIFSNGKSGRFGNFSGMNIAYTNAHTEDIYKRMYSVIANANIIIDTDLEEVEGETDALNHILAEAYTLRALVHFDLFRLFGQLYIDNSEDLGVSYITAFKDEENTQVARSTEQETKSQIIADINKAEESYEKGIGSSREQSKTNLTLDALYALESRIGIYFKDYAYTKEAAEKIYGKYEITPASEYLKYWSDQAPGKASIFELEYTSTDNPGRNSIAYIYRGEQYGDLEVYKNLKEDAEFSDSDVRFSNEMVRVDVNNRLRNYGKYPAMGSDLGTDNVKIFRYAEVVLNYAEAILEENPEKSKELLNEVALNRNSELYSEATQDNILKERRKEFLFEGFRLFDLARFHKEVREIDNNTPNTHGDVEPGSYRLALPIPRQEMDSNENVIQNLGY